MASPYARASQRAAILEAVAQLEKHDVASLTGVLNVSFEKTFVHA